MSGYSLFISDPCLNNSMISLALFLMSSSTVNRSFQNISACFLTSFSCNSLFLALFFNTSCETSAFLSNSSSSPVKIKILLFQVSDSKGVVRCYNFLNDQSNFSIRNFFCALRFVSSDFTISIGSIIGDSTLLIYYRTILILSLLASVNYVTY